MREVIVEVRQAIRQLFKDAGLSTVAIFTLALGIGAATAIFSLVHAILLKPLPFPHPEQLQLINTLQFPKGKQDLPPSAGNSLGTSYQNFFDWRERNHSFRSIAAYQETMYLFDAETGARARVLDVTSATSGLFETLGIVPELGRTFSREEEKPGNRSVILSHELWVSDFGASQNVIGRKVRISDQTGTIVGVMPAGFRFPLTHSASFWMTCSRDIEELTGRGESIRTGGYLEIVARLNPAITATQANAEVNSIQRSLALHFPEIVDQYAVEVLPEIESATSNVEKPLKLLMAAVSALLLIACANVAGLLLARASRRSGEMAVRAALGASHWRIIRPLLVEALLLGTSGGAFGVALACGLLRVSLKFVPRDLPRLDGVALDWPVLAFAVSVSLLTSLAAGLLPACRMRRVAPSMAMRDGGANATAGRHQNRLHSSLVVGETALALVLLVSSGLLIRSFDRVMHVDPGFDPRHVLQFGVALTDKRYSQEQVERFFARLLPRLRSMPGVRYASAGTPLPLSGSDRPGYFRIEGQPVTDNDTPAELITVVEPDFFETLRIPLLRGRFFVEADHDEHAPLVVVVNQAFAKKYFPGRDAIGQHLVVFLNQHPDRTREIIGVVGNIKRTNLRTVDEPEFFLPYAQALTVRPQGLIRVDGNPADYVHSVEGVLSELDPDAPAFNVGAMAEIETASVAQERFEAMLLSGFSTFALILSAVGLYGLLAYMVTQRTRELGVRMALGAGRANLLYLVFRRGLLLSALGMVLGLIAALFITPLLSDMLFGVVPLDKATFVVMTLALLVVTMLSSLLPAYRASQVDPIRTLRES